MKSAPANSWVTDLLLLLALITVTVSTFTAFTWWLAVTLLRPIIDILALFLLLISGGEMTSYTQARA